MTLLRAVQASTPDVADDLCDALDAIITERVLRKAARASSAARLKSLPRLSRTSLVEQVSLPELRAAVDVVTELVNPEGAEADTAAEMTRRFTTVRSLLSALALAAPAAGHQQWRL